MPMCAPCHAITINKRHDANGRPIPGHEALKETHQSGYKPFGQAGVIVKHYICETCGTKWAHENDRNDSHAGWSPV